MGVLALEAVEQESFDGEKLLFSLAGAGEKVLDVVDFAAG